MSTTAVGTPVACTACARRSCAPGSSIEAPPPPPPHPPPRPSPTHTTPHPPGVPPTPRPPPPPRRATAAASAIPVVSSLSGDAPRAYRTLVRGDTARRIPSSTETASAGVPTARQLP